MSRLIRRVPANFPWPRDKPWWGYRLDSIPCELCGGSGENPDCAEDNCCSACEGEGTCYPKVEIPTGEWYQYWEDISEGSPQSPPFATKEELARWLTENERLFTGRKQSYEAWMAFIDKGWAPSFALARGELIAGPAIATHPAFTKEPHP